MLKWEENRSRFGSNQVSGQLGDIEIFRVFYDGMRSRSASGGNWTIECKLSGLRPVLSKTFNGEDDAKAYAEKVLTDWLERTGLTFKEVSDEKAEK